MKPRKKRASSIRPLPGPKELFLRSWQAMKKMPRFIFVLLFAATSFGTAVPWSLTYFNVGSPLSGFATALFGVLITPISFAALIAITHFQARKRISLKAAFVLDDRLARFIGLQLILGAAEWFWLIAKLIAPEPQALIFITVFSVIVGLPLTYLSLRLLFVAYYIARSDRTPFASGFRATKGRLFDIYKAEFYLLLPYLVVLLPLMLRYRHFLEDKKDPIYWILTFSLSLLLTPLSVAHIYGAAEISQTLHRSKR